MGPLFVVAFALACRKPCSLQELHEFAVLHRLRHKYSIDPLYDERLGGLYDHSAMVMRLTRRRECAVRDTQARGTLYEPKAPAAD